MPDKKEIVYMKWTREAKVKEVGGLGVYIEPGDTYEDLFEKAKRGEYANFRTLDRVYTDEKWHYGPFDTTEHPDDEVA